MKDIRWGLFVTILLVTGCLDSADPAAPSPTGPKSRVAPPGAPDGFSADLGRIEGLVVTSETEPVAGANVSIFDPFELTATTDDDGRFAFERLAPDTYSLVAMAPGYKAQARKIEVGADMVAEAHLILEAVAVLEPFTASFVDEGFLTLQLVAPGTPATNPGGLLTLAPGAGRDKWVFHHPSQDELAGYVGALAWTANQYFSARNMTLHANSTHDQPGHFLNTSRGPSPVLLRIVLPEPKSAGVVTSQLYLVNECAQPADCASKPPERWQQVVFQQRFHVYSTLFYVEPPPESYSPLPDG